VDKIEKNTQEPSTHFNITLGHLPPYNDYRRIFFSYGSKLGGVD